MSLPGPGGSPGAGLVCAVCLHVRTGTAEDAVTTLGGYAVCEDHLGIVAQGEEWHRLIIAARRAAEPPPPAEE